MRKQSSNVCDSILRELKFRMGLFQDSIQEAARKQEWARAAGYQGVETGLIIAEQIVKKHLKSISSPARNPRSISENAPSLH